MSVLAIRGLRLSAAGGDLLDDVTLVLAPGEIVGLVGESAAGKTTVGLAALGFVVEGVDVADGSVEVDGSSLFACTERELRRIRGRRIGYVAQDPAAALNPALTIGAQLDAALDAHQSSSTDNGRVQHLADLLQLVALPPATEVLDRYPHELSGGQLQRAALAVALACDPDVLILDEPTSGLDGPTAVRLVATIRRLCAEGGLSVLCISHDLGLVGSLADRIAVMYAGHIVEHGPTASVLADPAHPYTRHLIAAVPDPSGSRPMVGLAGRNPAPGRRPGGCRFAPRCDLAADECRVEVPALVEVGPDRSARCVMPFTVPHALRSPGGTARRAVFTDRPILRLEDVTIAYRGNVVIGGASIELGCGEWLAVVGDSGSGKTTLLRTIAGLHREWTGRIDLAGSPLATAVRQRTVAQRRALQLVFQHPYGSFNPRRTISDAIARAARLAGVTRGDDSDVEAMLAHVALGAEAGGRYPDQLSGGELQRAAIARALAARPTVLLCDEITVSLDPVVQAAIIELLDRLRRALGLTIVFVTHDHALVTAAADRTLVLADGRFGVVAARP